MAHYLFQGGYAQEAWVGLVKNPEDRTAAVRAALESLGGRLDAIYYTTFHRIGGVPQSCG
jgi:uncharacterized protein with GYD domain